MKDELSDLANLSDLVQWEIAVSIWPLAPDAAEAALTLHRSPGVEKPQRACGRVFDTAVIARSGGRRCEDFASTSATVCQNESGQPCLVCQGRWLFVSRLVMLGDMNFTSRHCVPELMDQPGLDQQQHRQALDGLRRVNRISATSGIFWPIIQTLAGEIMATQLNGRPLSVLDVACGGGDVAVSMAQRANRAGIKLRIDGCDISAVAVQHAQQQAARAEVDVSFFQHDVFADCLPEGYDVLTCSLFLHHLNETDAIGLMRKMAAAAGHLVLIDDLRRTRVGYLLAWAGCRLLSRSPIVHHDGPQSVVAAFSDSEARELAKQAGMGDVTISRHWPQRFLLTWRRA